MSASNKRPRSKMEHSAQCMDDGSGQMLACIARAQSGFIQDDPPQRVFGSMLKDLLALTGSTYGFIGEVLHDEAGAPYLKTYALTNISWDAGTKALYKKTAQQGLEFRNLETLFGYTISTGKELLTNAPARHKHARGLPPGHPPLDSYLGLPLKSGSRLVGMVGIANRAGGYDRSLVNSIKPFIATCANIMSAYRAALQNKQSLYKHLQTHDFLQTVVDAIAAPVYFLDRDMRIGMVNKAGREEFKGGLLPGPQCKCFEVFHGSAVACPKEECPWQEVMQTGKSTSCVHVHHMGNGQECIVEISASPIFDEEGAVQGVVVTHHDITVERMAQDTIHAAHERLATVLDGLDAIVYVADLHTHEVLYVNRHTRQILGEALGKRCWEFFQLGQTGPCTFCTNDQLLDDQGRPAGVYVWEHFNEKTMRWYHIRDQAISWVDGRVVRLEVATDITEHKNLESALRLAEAQWRNTFDSISDFVSVHSVDYRILKANKALCDFLHKDEADIVGKHCYELLHHTCHPIEACPHKVLVETKGSVTREVLDNEIGVPLLVSVSPIEGPDGELLGSVHIAKDISLYKRIEEELRNSLHDKDMLIKEVHHRVKNNLTVIASLLSLQSRQIKDTAAIGAFAESRHRVRSMSLIHEKLYRSTDLKSIDVHSYVRELVTELFHSYKVQGAVRLDLQVEPMQMDIDTLIPCGLIINELVSNSLKYAFPGVAEGTITVALAHAQQGEGYVLKVGDNGSGLPEGFDPKNCDTLGMMLINSLSAQLGGQPQLQTSGGVSFTLAFRERKVR